jgi:hypothetical protein
LETQTGEHFPNLHQHGLAQVGDRIVLVNRTREGRLEVFDDLVFHGGAGSTLEMRRFSETGLRSRFRDAGFKEVRIYSEGYAPFGVCHAETWSLPMTARKEPFTLDAACVAELVGQSAKLRRRLFEEVQRSQALNAEYERFADWAKQRTAELEKEMVERTHWAQDLEGQLAQRTEWAQNMEKDLRHHVDLAKQFQADAREKSDWAMVLEAEVQDLRVRLERFRRMPWTKAGRALGFVKE